MEYVCKSVEWISKMAGDSTWPCRVPSGQSRRKYPSRVVFIPMGNMHHGTWSIDFVIFWRGKLWFSSLYEEISKKTSLYSTLRGVAKCTLAFGHTFKLAAHRLYCSRLSYMQSLNINYYRMTLLISSQWLLIQSIPWQHIKPEVTTHLKLTPVAPHNHL